MWPQAGPDLVQKSSVCAWVRGAAGVLSMMLATGRSADRWHVGLVGVDIM